jgi:hypothetical protein
VAVCCCRGWAWRAGVVRFHEGYMARAGLMVLDRILFLVHLVMYSISLHRHRTAPENRNLPRNGAPVKEGKMHEMGGVRSAA